ncbi:GAF domain-containing protein [Salisediminibacterium selenitireducens]|uniref:GAF domain-containing protein n=1 Tax=Bacillus selenitireducens (strain ATCC 700615 / DSM 15326 / MLS10) TaxID=439292 RepID=D6XSQ0_BACIE|nr:GAF domain-containing protein [Salisediminibacterium selenitireducens]ADH98836.1 GAF domain-containing protein [[Bacillus] selenitireducens MLS10]
MFESLTYSGTVSEQYKQLNRQLDALLSGEYDRIAHLSNASSLLNQFLKEVNWVGFYLMKQDELILGPFQGLPACVRIPKGKGVCGTAVSEGMTQRIDNVHEFPGHIACDAASNSEIVIPIYLDGDLYGVLDIDSPSFSRFSEEDQQGLEAFTEILTKHLRQSS